MPALNSERVDPLIRHKEGNGNGGELHGGDKSRKIQESE